MRGKQPCVQVLNTNQEKTYFKEFVVKIKQARHGKVWGKKHPYIYHTTEKLSYQNAKSQP